MHHKYNTLMDWFRIYNIFVALRNKGLWTNMHSVFVWVTPILFYHYARLTQNCKEIEWRSIYCNYMNFDSINFLLNLIKISLSKRIILNECCMKQIRKLNSLNNRITQCFKKSDQTDNKLHEMATIIVK